MSRRLEGKIDDYFIQEDLSLRSKENVDVYEGVHLDGLSMNLMGGGFKEEYISIRQKGFGIEDWDGKTTIGEDKCEGCWDVLENPCFAIFYRASKLHNTDIPYTKQNQVHTDVKLDTLKANLSSISKMPDAGKKYGSMKIEHHPTNLNYWHVELREYSEGEEPLPKGKKAWVRDIKSFTKKQLIKYPLLTMDSPSVIPTEFFMKKKIKLVTFFPHPNFGTCLQSYALNKVLQDMGHAVEFIYNRNEIAPELKGTDSLSLMKQLIKGFIKMILPQGVVKQIKRKREKLREDGKSAAIQDVSEVLYILDLPNKPLLKWLCKQKCFLNLYYKSTYSTPQEKKVFKFTFLDGNYKPRRLFTKSDYSRVSQDADMFITGSDQIWNPFCGGFNPMMFLEFAGDKKRIAYSSSISRPDFPTEIKDRVKKDLSKFQHIAVREQHSVELINDMLGRNDTKLVVDPTMLLSKEQWQSFADRANIEFEVPEKYIFCYFVGNRPEYIDMVNDVKQKTGIKDVITVDCIGNKTRYGDGIVYHDGGPYEWVYLLSHASMICMDSFHATVFALKFHKDFVHILKTKPSEGNANSSQNGRMYDILSRYGILYKLYNKENVNWLKPIDFDHIDKIMNEEIKDSLSYLKWEIEN